MLELTTINTTELTNKKLGTQLNAIKKAVDTGNNQQWKIADAIATIVDDELFVDDFETEGNLAKVLGMSRSNLNKMKKASHYHKEVAELNAFTLTKIMELLVIPQDKIVEFLDDYMITPSSTCREVRDAVSAWKDDNIVADAEITDAEDAEDTTDENESESTVVDDSTDENESESTVVDDSTDSSTSNIDDDALAEIKKIIDLMNREELLELKEYIERWL